MQRPRDKGGTKGVFVKENFHNRVACWRSVFPWLWASLNKFARPRQPLVRPWTTPKDPSLRFPLVSLFLHLLSPPYFFLYFFYSSTFFFFFFLFNDRLCTIIPRTKARLAFPSSKRNGIWGRLRFVHAREPEKIEGGHAFFTGRACHRSIRHDRRRWPHATNTCHYVDSFDRSRRRRIVYFNLVPLTGGIKESRTTFTLLVYTPRGETSRSLTL